MEARIPFLEVSDAIVYSGAETLYWCMQCGLCTGTCPYRLVPGAASEEFNIRLVQHLGQLGLEGFESENCLFACTTCRACVDVCPRGVEIINNVMGMRRMLAEVGTIPPSLKTIAGSLHSQGNPWSGPRDQRTAWIKDVEVPTFSEQTEYFLFVCCTSCFDARSQNIARSVAKALTAAGISFGIIGNEESCCGEAIRKVGDEQLFQNLAQANVKLYNSKGVKKIIVTSPHCLYTFKNEYPELGGEWEVFHYSEILASAVSEGRLKLSGSDAGAVTFHDPCYLGRHIKLYDPPRQLLQSLPGADLKELARTKNKSVCCQGGGGRVWMETAAGERFAELRINDAVATGAKTLVTACPYCITMLEDSLKVLGKQDELSVKELSELVAERI
ncbi:MAG: (Fe-S)-binding protein [Thermodesulfobacteriota bacterium]